MLPAVRSSSQTFGHSGHVLPDCSVLGWAAQARQQPTLAANHAPFFQKPHVM
eukprot:NODE_4564_length_1875_cov_7.442792.p11 GENE.NODE_4564_length_1875_cov_7.442792~~NODE_4564_length_1875_cov_7.442792.p11  ORF type:complete len:52 (-),score=8.25 NODE_4564_length_1875_cov_7.442792:1236-1391(-)